MLITNQEQMLNIKKLLNDFNNNILFINKKKIVLRCNIICDLFA